MSHIWRHKFKGFDAGFPIAIDVSENVNDKIFEN